MQLWADLDAFKTSLRLSKDRTPFTFYDGPYVAFCHHLSVYVYVYVTICITIVAIVCAPFEMAR